MRFILLVEGHTERNALAPFLKRWLDPRLTRPVGIRIDRFDGWQDFSRKAPKKAQDYLAAPDRDEIIAVIGLLDLYGPNCYPERLTTSEERHRWGVQDIERRVDHEKFRMFFAVHEVEAWILSQPDILPFKPSNPDVKRMNTPEKVNFSEPPSYLLDRLFMASQRYHYKKTTHAIQLFSRLDPEVAYKKCPYLKETLDEMLKLAKEHGL